jgi:PAS domain S-box-containing protein/putative nucleotidyltransferase with HDIG domain
LLHILILAADDAEAALMEVPLRNAGLDFVVYRAAAKAAFVEALETFSPDVALVEQAVPEFDERQALEYVRGTHPEIPVVMVMGPLGEEAAVQLLNAGAKDYVLKGNPVRLAPAVRRVITQEQAIRVRKAAERAIRQSEERFRALIDSFGHYAWQTNESGVYTYVSSGVSKSLGYSPEELVGRSPYDLMSAVEVERVRLLFEAIRESRAPFSMFESLLLHKDGQEVVMEASGIASFDEGGVFRGYYGINRDISERRRADVALRRVNRALQTLSAGNLTLTSAESEPAFLDGMCRVLVEIGGFAMAWIGYAEHDENRSVRVVAAAGDDLGYLKAVSFSWSDVESGQGPVGVAIRTGTPEINSDFANNPHVSLWRDEALKRGLVSSMSFPLRDGCSIFGALTIYSTKISAFVPEEVRILAEVSGDLAFGIVTLRTRALHDESVARAKKAMHSTVMALASTLEQRDPYTAGHQRNVAKLAVAIAVRVGIPREERDGIELAALIHDIGKIQVPAEILSKPGRLSALELQMLHAHVQTGFDIVKGVDFPWPIAEMILQHHERLDGSGYPSGLKADAIRPGAKIISVADVVESMTHHRPYRAALGIEAALTEITKGRDRIFDATFVDACVAVFREEGFTF